MRRSPGSGLQLLPLLRQARLTATDNLTYGTYQAARELGLEERIRFMGIDGLPGEGCVWVRSGILAATFLYPTPGEAGLEIALDILEGSREITPGERITLPTATITIENVEEFLK